MELGDRVVYRSTKRVGTVIEFTRGGLPVVQWDDWRFATSLSNLDLVDVEPPAEETEKDRCVVCGNMMWVRYNFVWCTHCYPHRISSYGPDPNARYVHPDGSYFEPYGSEIKQWQPTEEPSDLEVRKRERHEGWTNGYEQMRIDAMEAIGNLPNAEDWPKGEETEEGGCPVCHGDSFHTGVCQDCGHSIGEEPPVVKAHRPPPEDGNVLCDGCMMWVRDGKKCSNCGALFMNPAKRPEEGE